MSWVVTGPKNQRYVTFNHYVMDIFELFIQFFDPQISEVLPSAP